MPVPRLALIRRLRFKRTPYTELGHGAIGIHYLGFMKLARGARKRVAIKGFFEPLSDRKVKLYRNAIRRLHAVGAPIIKIGFVKMKLPDTTPSTATEKWVQVSELWGSARGSKFLPNDYMKYYEKEDTLELKKKMVLAYTKIARAGLRPQPDVLGVLKNKKDVRIIDLDMLVERLSKLTEHRLTDIAWSLKKCIAHCASPSELEVLNAYAYNHAGDMLRPFLK